MQRLSHPVRTGLLWPDRTFTETTTVCASQAIVRCYEHFIADNGRNLCIVQSYCGGGDLKKNLQTRFRRGLCCCRAASAAPNNARVRRLRVKIACAG